MRLSVMACWRSKGCTSPTSNMSLSAAISGKIEILPVPGLEYPEIFTVSLDPDKALSAEYLKGTFHWHIGATDDIPNKATMLNALEVSAIGGETQFCNTYAAWEALPDDRKARCQG